MKRGGTPDRGILNDAIQIHLARSVRLTLSNKPKEEEN